MGEALMFGAQRRKDSCGAAFAALTPSGRRRYALASKMLLRSHFVEPQVVGLIRTQNTNKNAPPDG